MDIQDIARSREKKAVFNMVLEGGCLSNQSTKTMNDKEDLRYGSQPESR